MPYNETTYLRQCLPVFANRLQNILQDLRELGWMPRICCVRRSNDEEIQKLKQGFGEAFKKSQAQAPLESAQIQGDIAEVMDELHELNGIRNDTNSKFWRELGRAARKHGCEWGGDWKEWKDVRHVQMRAVERPRLRLVS